VSEAVERVPEDMAYWGRGRFSSVPFVAPVDEESYAVDAGGEKGAGARFEVVEVKGFWGDSVN
jgi:hypothetical protein